VSAIVHHDLPLLGPKIGGKLHCKQSHTQVTACAGVSLGDSSPFLNTVVVLLDASKMEYDVY